MKKFDEYKIQFAGLKLGKHYYDYHVNEDFFEDMGYEEFNSARVDISLLLEKKENMLELHFGVNGTVNVICDVSLEPYDQPIKNELDLVVKFGEQTANAKEDLLLLPATAHELNLRQYIYEAAVLAVPYKKVHPQVADGTMKSDILDKLEDLSPGNSNKNDNTTDPRWDKLKDLLNEN